MTTTTRLLFDGGKEITETVGLYGDDEVGSRTTITRNFPDFRNWTDKDWTDFSSELDVNKPPILVSQITTTEAKKNKTTGQEFFSGNTVIRCLAPSNLSNIPNRKLELSSRLIKETDSSGKFMTDGNFKLTLNGRSATFFDIDDKDFLKISSQIPSISKNIPSSLRPKAFGERIMAIKTFQAIGNNPLFSEMAKDLENLYKKGYPEAGLTLAHMYQQQALQAEKNGDQSTVTQANSEANRLFQEIINSKETPLGLKGTARGMQSGVLKGPTVKDMNFAREAGLNHLTESCLVALGAAIGVSALGTTIALSPIIGVAAGGLFLYHKAYKNASPLQKSGLRAASDSALKDLGSCISKLVGGR